MIFYKVIKNGKAKDGGNFDYTPYLPKKGKKGVWTPEIKNVSLCSKGYHVTPYWNMYFEKGCSVYEVDCKGIAEIENSVGVIDKYVCESILFLKKITPKIDKQNNTGYWNTGSWNTGDWNTGYWNTGVSNTGNRNTGSWNTGNRNTGSWNTGSWNTGWFNTPAIKPVRLLFGKPYEGIPTFPRYFYFQLKGGYKESWKRAFDGASIEEIKQTIQIPHFDYEMFEEITGITKKQIESRLKGV